MDKPNTMIIFSAIALGALFAWLMEYTEWWQWLLSIIVMGIVVYCVVSLCMLLVSVIAGIVLLKYWENHKKEIKVKLRVMWERVVATLFFKRRN